MPYPNYASTSYLAAIHAEHRSGIITLDELNGAARRYGERMQRAAMEAAMEAMRDSPELPCCESCGCTVEDGIEIDGNHYCDEGCAHDDGWEACQRCGEWHDEIDRVEFQDGRGEWHCYCSPECAERDGFTQCDRCGEWEHDHLTRAVHDGEWQRWCESCHDDYAYYCNGCGDYYSPDEIYTDDYGDHYCDSCYHDRNHEDLHEYGYAPMLRFHGNAKGSPYLGVELETDSGDDRNGYVDDLMEIDGGELFWLTEDSSLTNGVEITTHPMTLGYHAMNRSMYESIAEAARRHGFVSHDSGNCGLHVHVNRDFFGKSEAVQDAGGYKMMRLLQRFENQFTAFARRRDNHWCSYKTRDDYSPRKITEPNHPMDGMLRKSRRMKNEKDHSQALNFQHRATFEFRIFRGTLKVETLFASLALVNGMAHVAKSHGSVYVEDVDWYTLMHDVVEACDEEYPRECLKSYLADKELL